jgi:hypothetical protein
MIRRLTSVLRTPALWLVLGSLALAGLVVWHLPAGGGIDTAAHAYKVAVAQAGGSWLWDGLWYSGSYAAATYGYLYYLVAAHTGQTVLVVCSASALPALFWCYLRGVWDLTPRMSIAASTGLAVTVALALPFGEYPFLVGLAMAMAGAALLATKRLGWAAVAALPFGAALFVNPLSVLCVGVLLAADLLARPTMRRHLAIFAAAVAPFAALRLAMTFAFVQPSVEIDLLGPQAKFVAMGLGGALLVRLSRDPDRRAKSMVFLAAAAACALAWTVPHNPVGDDMGRFYMIFGVPVLLTVRRLCMPLRTAAVLGCAVLVLPLAMAGAIATTSGPSFADWQAFFAPGLRLAGRYYDPNYRFEVVPMAKHWEAYFFPLAGYPLAQGWYRQSDAIHNAALRDPNGSATQYAAWLRNVAVRYIFVPHATLQPSAAVEPHLLASSPQFVRVADVGRWTVYRVRNPRPIAAPSSGFTANPAAEVVRYGRTELTLSVSRAGRYTVKETWSPYWALVRGAGSLARAPGDWLVLRAAKPGEYKIRFDVTTRRVLDQLL